MLCRNQFAHRVTHHARRRTPQLPNLDERDLTNLCALFDRDGDRVEAMCHLIAEALGIGR
jgi:hypothetical protein